MSAVARIKEMLSRGEAVGAAAALREALQGSVEYLEQINAAKLLDRLEADAAVAERLAPVRLAVLGSSTTAQLLPLLRLHCFKEGLKTEIYDAPLGAYPQEILDPKSGLYAFKPRIALFFVNYRDARPGPAEEEAARWQSLWDALRERANCAVIMNNFDAPVERPWGNLEASRADVGVGWLRRINASFAERAGKGAAILDQEHLSSVVGKERWHDPRFWEHSMQAMSFEALTRYAAEAAALVKAVLGRSRKCLVVDLDNTLWGGVAGEDGAAGLDLNESYLNFQKYLKALVGRGVLLAACSKNEEAVAREAFLKRPEMVLKLDDFSAFVANWEDKATNLRAIVRQLNIGLDAMAFADDTASERELVRRFCPEAAVVDLPADPSEFTRTLDRLRFFETVAVSGEDAARAAHFKAEGERRRAQEAAPNLDAFLKDLDMRASAGPFEEADVERITQLVNKTNQFNLTTRRYTEPEVRAMMKDSGARTLAVRLSDRLGDYGLVSIAILRRKGEAMEIDTWLMSCRVLGRRLEWLVFNRLVELSRSSGARALVGDYLPTPKNVPVKDLLPGLGFKRAEDGRWRLELSAVKPLEVPIQDGSAAAAR